jgi:WD40 repeat protein
MLAPAPTHALAMSADGAWLASGSGRFEKPEISLWHSGKKDPQHPSLVGHTDMVNALAFSPDGKWLISGSEDETIRVWDVSTGQTIKILKEHTSAVLAIATAPGMAVSASADGTVKVWDIPSGGLRMTLTGHTDEVRAVAVTADGRYAASGGKDGVLKRWDLKTGKELWSVPAHIGSINAVAIGDDGTIATAGNDHGVRIWSPADGSQAADLEGHTDEVHALSFVSNLPLLVSGDFERGASMRVNGTTVFPHAMAFAAAPASGIYRPRRRRGC